MVSRVQLPLVNVIYLTSSLLSALQRLTHGTLLLVFVEFRLVLTPLTDTLSAREASLHVSVTVPSALLSLPELDMCRIVTMKEASLHVLPAHMVSNSYDVVMIV